MKIVTFNLRMENPDDGPHRFTLRREAIVARIREEQLPEYQFVGHGRSADYLDEATPVAYRKSRFDLKRYETFWLSDTPEVPGSRFLEDQSICPRVCVLALLHDRQTGRNMRIVNTHLDHEGPIARKKGLAQIVQRLARENCDIATVLMGDFNCPPTDEALESVYGASGLRDVTGHIPLTFHAFRGYYPWKQEKIDYLFVTRNIRVTACKIWDNGPDGVCLSDHYPVCACLEVEEVRY